MEAIELEPYSVGERKTRVGHVRRTPEERERLLGLYDASGISSRQFVREQGIAYSTFMSWICARNKRADGSEGNDSNKRNCSKPTFAQVALPDGFPQVTSVASPLEVCLPSGIIIRASHKSDVALIGSLVRELQGSR